MSQDLNEKVQRFINRINQMELEEEDKALAVAAIYVDYGQNDKAIEILENLTKFGVQTASKYLILAGVYQRESLYHLTKAEEKCEEALELAKATGDIEEQVAAKAGLAQIKALLGKQKEAESYLVNEDELNALKVEQNSDVEKRLERLKSLISGKQQLLFAALGDCLGCNGQSNYRPSGFGGNTKCLYCGDG